MSKRRAIFLLSLFILYAIRYVAVSAQDAPSENLAVGQSTQELTRLAQASPMIEGMPSVTPIAGGMEARISLDLRNIEVLDSLKFLAMKAKLNIIATKNVTGRVTLIVENVAVQDIFDIMLRSNELAYSKEGDIYNVMTEAEFKALFGRRFGDVRKVRMFRLDYAIPEQVFGLLDTLKSDIGRVLVEPDSGTALVMDTPERIKQIEKAVATFEQKNELRTFNLKYAKAKDMEDQLRHQLEAKKVGTVKADERSNQVTVQALPGRMQDVVQLIAALDQKTKEVLIDAIIIKVKLLNDKTKNIEWEGLLNAGKQLGMLYMGSTPFSVFQPTVAGSPWSTRSDYLESIGGQVGAYQSSLLSKTGTGAKIGPGLMHVGIIDAKRDFDVLIKYLETLGRTQILSNPKLAVVNNQEAKIHVGERQAYVTTTTTSGGQTTTVSEDVSFVDVGIQLFVTPTINDDGYITMKVKPEISSVVSTLLTPTGNKIPIIDTSMAETTVMVKDGKTIIIGGLRKEEKVYDSVQVPFLSSIPILGNLFRNNNMRIERTEILVMITPHIISGDTLIAGDERAFGTKPGKEYKEYTHFTNQTDYQPPVGLPEEKIKSYHEYKGIKQEIREYMPSIKGDVIYDAARE